MTNQYSDRSNFFIRSEGFTIHSPSLYTALCANTYVYNEQRKTSTDRFCSVTNASLAAVQKKLEEEKLRSNVIHVHGAHLFDKIVIVFSGTRIFSLLVVVARLKYNGTRAKNFISCEKKAKATGVKRAYIHILREEANRVETFPRQR